MAAIVAAAVAFTTVLGAVTKGGEVVAYFFPTKAEFMAHEARDQDAVRLAQERADNLKEWMMEVDFILTQNLIGQSTTQELELQRMLVTFEEQYAECLAAGKGSRCEPLNPDNVRKAIAGQKENTRSLRLRSHCLQAKQPPPECKLPPPQ